ncbi:2698_t:CDS:1 [Funneliformis caledonium]|uniref:2698_t:CDS:1 n=1 Tax=Funneliformis caledonium TaxID=1117310 RepID=A0A9N8VAI5_9GLOM|nr:2698_t:CDS:1 [Funneliformis caledonium]
MATSQDDSGLSNASASNASHNSTSVSQENGFFYRPNNDFQIYIIYCKEITLNELTSQLLNIHLYSTCNYLYSNNHFEFYFQHPNDQRIYHIDCEMIPHSAIVQHLNLNVFGIELRQNDQQSLLEFTNDHKQNLEFHLRRSLIDYLAPNMISGNENQIDGANNTSLVNIRPRNVTDNNQSPTSQQDNNNRLV